MGKTDKILGGITKKIEKLNSVADAEKQNAERLREKAKQCYAMPDKVMESVQRIASILNGIVMSVNRKAFAKAQEIGRKAGAHDEESSRAKRVADKFSELVA